MSEGRPGCDGILAGVRSNPAVVDGGRSKQGLELKARPLYSPAPTAMPAEDSQPSGLIASVPQEVTEQPRRVVVGGVSWRDTFAALKHRNFRLFFIGQLVSLTGSWMQNTAQGWLVYQLTGSKVLLGTVAAVGDPNCNIIAGWSGFCIANS